MIERNARDEFVRVRCDGCGLPAPANADLIVNHGLNGLGWDCRGGSHKCPVCKGGVGGAAE